MRGAKNMPSIGRACPAQDAENTAVGERGERSYPVYGKNHPVRSSSAAAGSGTTFAGKILKR